MFNYLFHPYLRWLRHRSESDTPDFNIDRYGSPSQNLAQPPANSPIPESDVLLRSAAPTGLVHLVAEQPTEVPGFRVGLRDEVPGFNTETALPDRLEPPPPKPADTARTLALPPGVEEPEPPTPQLPAWLRNILAIPVPRLSTALDPHTGRRIVPYEPLVNWMRPHPAIDQNVREIGAGAYRTEIGAIPSPSSFEVPTIKQSPYPSTLDRLADLNIHPDYPRPKVQEARWNSWSDPVKDGQTDTRTGGVNPEDPWRAVVQPPQQPSPFPQGERTRPSGVPETALSQRPVGIPPTPLIGASPIEHAVYNPDVDPGYDDLFDLVGVGENKKQGDSAKDTEAARRVYPKKRMAQEIRIYAEGAPNFMVADIVHRANGTTVIVITEVKSGDGRLSANQAENLAKAVRTGAIYIVNEAAAQALQLKPRQTFAQQRIIPEVYVVGGNQAAIERQLRNQGVEVIPQKVRHGQPPRLRVGAPPT